MRFKRPFFGSYWRFCAALILGCMVINPAVGYAEDVDPPPLDAPIDDQADDEETEAEKAAKRLEVTRKHMTTKFDKDYDKSEKLLDALNQTRNVTLFAGIAGAFVGLFLMWLLAGISPAGAWWQWVLVLVAAMISQHGSQRYLLGQSATINEALNGFVELESSSIKTYGIHHFQSGHFRDTSDSLGQSTADESAKMLSDLVKDFRKKRVVIKQALVEINRMKEGRFHSAWFLKYGLGTGGFAVLLLILTSIITRRVPGLAG